MNGTLTNKEMMNLNNNIMRKLVFTLLMFLTLSMSAQKNEVIRFMGIPIDGPKSEMLLELKEKGFEPINDGLTNDDASIMKGYFNGEKCTLSVNSYHNNVYNIIVVFDQEDTEINAKLRLLYYNELLGTKYVSNPTGLDELSHFTTSIDEFDKPHGSIYLGFTDRYTGKFGNLILDLTNRNTNVYQIVISYLNIDKMPNGEDL